MMDAIARQAPAEREAELLEHISDLELQVFRLKEKAPERCKHQTLKTDFCGYCSAQAPLLSRAYIQIQRLLNRVNYVTSYYRHWGAARVSDGAFVELSERQIEIEAWLKTATDTTQPATQIQAGLNAPQEVPVASNSGVNGGRERADTPVPCKHEFEFKRTFNICKHCGIDSACVARPGDSKDG